jgi:SAM-dependent methyltransferase
MNTTKKPLRRIAKRSLQALGVLPARPWLRRLGLSRYFYPRDRLAYKYLRGNGLEIGALNQPVTLPRAAKAEYLDVASREDLFRLRYFDGLKITEMVEVNHVGNGFLLEGLPSDHFDFLIANHVLEHSPDPIGVLENWFRVLKPSGILFCSVPIASRCFDRGRPVATFEHILGDYQSYRSGNVEAISTRNREHYLEWVGVSEPGGAESELPHVPGEAPERRAARLQAKEEGIHFHAFDRDSFQELFAKLGEDVFPGSRVLEVVESGIETIALVRKGQRKG